MLQPFIQVLNWESSNSIREELPFRVRYYRWYDLHKVMKLFYDTVHHVCVEDYSEEQLRVWAPEELDRKSWEKSLRANICFVAEYKKQIIGFGDLKPGAGEINRLYTHKDFQGRGVARAILARLEKTARKYKQKSLRVESSLTGKDFYQSQGFICKDILTGYLNDQAFFNYLMEKELEVEIPENT